MIRTLLRLGMLPRAVTMLIGLLMTGQLAIGQLPTATILGVVKDSSGAVVAGSSLTVRNVDTAETRTTVSEADGSFRLSALPVGNYELRAEHAGFQTEVQSGITLTVSQEAVINVSLQVGSVNQTVSVTSEAPLVNVTNPSLGGLVSEERVADLPLNGRNYVDLVLLQTGVAKMVNIAQTNGMAGDWFSTNGAPLRSNNYLLDGAPLEGALGGPSAAIDGSTLGVDGVREFRVATDGFSAEYGTVMGSQTIIVSKSGTNTLHGDVFEYLRNSALDAKNYFDTPATSDGHRLPEYRRNNFGGALGGPIKKDKTFVFGVYEGLRLQTGITTVNNVMATGCHGAAGATITNAACPQLGSTASVKIAPQVAPLLALFPTPNLPKNQFTFPLTLPTRDDYGQVRVDQNISDHDKFFTRYTITDSLQPNTPPYPQINNVGASRSQFLTLAEDHIFSPTLLNSFRTSYSRSSVQTNSSSNLIGPEYSFIPGLDIGDIAVGGVTTFGPGLQTYKVQNIFTWGDDVFYTHGRHSLKMGVLIYDDHWFFNLKSNTRGTLSFANVASFLGAIPTSYTALTPGSIVYRYYEDAIPEFYVQDDVRVTSRFTLNLGLRYQFATQMQETHHHAAAFRDPLTDVTTTIGIPFENNTKKDFSPRVGFAWDVRGDGKTAVRSGFGLLYDMPINLGNALNTSAQGTPPFSSATTVTNPGTFAVPFNLNTGTQAIAARTIDYYLKQPYMLEYNLTVERQLPFGMAATLTYAGSRGIHLNSQTDANPKVPEILAGNVQFWPVSAVRANPHWNSISLVSSLTDSYYNSFQFQLLKRLSNGLQFQSSYTWSKLIDDTQGGSTSDSTNDSSYPSDPTRLRFDRGLADFDIAQVWHFNAIYNLPQRTSGNEVVGKFLNGWWISAIETLQSGPPFTVALNSNRSNSGVASSGAGIDRPNLAPGRTPYNITHGVSTSNGVDPCPTAGNPLGTPTLWYDPCAFEIPTAGYLGDVGRNILFAPGLANLDFSLVKDTSLKLLGEGGKVEFRVEVFNILNHPNFDAPNRTVYAALQNVEAPLATAGGITSTTPFTSRQIQFALKLLW